MYYKIIINKDQLSFKNLNKILQLISKLYIIITIYNNLQYYIIYLLINNISDLSHLFSYDCKIIKSTKIVHYIIYKIFLLVNYNKTNYLTALFVDNTFYNIDKIKYNHNLDLLEYLKLFKINNKLNLILYNYLNYYNYKLLWLYHNNLYYVNFLQNYIYNYKKYKTLIIDKNIILLDHLDNLNNKLEEYPRDKNYLKLIKNKLISIFDTEINYKYIIINLYDIFQNLSINELNDLSTLLRNYSYNYLKEQKIITKIKYNIIILSSYINVSLLYKLNNYDNYITFNTFNSINY